MKLKKLLAAVLAGVMLTSISITANASGAVLNDAGSFTGALINIKDAGLSVGGSYEMTIRMISNGASGFRVRYSSTDSGAGDTYNDISGAHSEGAAVVKEGANKVSQIPAYFKDVFNDSNMGTEQTFIVDFTIGASISGLSPLYLDYILIQGQQGATNFEITGVEIKDNTGKTVASAGKAGEPAVTTVPEVTTAPVVTTTPVVTQPVVVQKAVKDLKITGIAAKAYTGKAIKPAITVKDGSKTLKSGTDYTVSYKNNTKIGTASVTITGKGDTYTGSVTKTFKINPAKVKGVKASNSSKGQVSLTWTAQKNIKSYIVYYSTSKDGEYKKLKTVSKSSYTTSGLKAGTYYFKVSAVTKVDGKTFIGAKSAAVKRSVK